MYPFPVNFWGGARESLFQVNESVVLVDEVFVAKINRIVNKQVPDLIAVTETIQLEKEISVQESVGMLDLVQVQKLSRVVNKQIPDLIAVTEAISLTIVGTPVISSCTALEDVGCFAYVTFDTGVYCESVDIWYSVNLGVYQFLETINTTPSTAGYNSSQTLFSLNDEVTFRVEPYNQDGGAGGGGDHGTDCFDTIPAIQCIT